MEKKALAALYKVSGKGNKWKLPDPHGKNLSKKEEDELIKVMTANIRLHGSPVVPREVLFKSMSLTCGICGETKPVLTEPLSMGFGLRKRTNDGVTVPQSRCTMCRSIASKESAARRRAGKQAKQQKGYKIGKKKK